MRSWKALIAGFLIFCLLPVWPGAPVSADEAGEEWEAEDQAPDSASIAIESNEIEGWPQGPVTESAAAAVLDIDTGTFLYSKNAEATMYPASTTKIMTALLAVENCDLDDDITFSEIVYDLEEGSSHLGIQAGETLNLRDAVYGLMLASANDIANGIAEYMGGSLSGFADLMNARAAELGCVNTHFANPHGLYQDEHYTCARDMALIAAAAYENPVFREIVGTREYTIPETNLTEEERSFLNHQKMMQEGEEFYRDWCTGGKTGYTSQCLNTLVTYGEKDGQRLVSVVFRAEGSEVAYADSTRILEYGFDEFSNVTLDDYHTGRTFYGVMGLGYLGDAAELQSPVWMREPVTDGSVRITLPATASPADLTCRLASRSGAERTFSYEFHGHPVGTASGVFRPVWVPARPVSEGKQAAHVTVTADEEALQRHIQAENLNEVLAQTAEIFRNGYRIFAEYTQGHAMTVLAGGMILIVLLILFIVVLVFRCTSESRIRRRRKLEEQERKRREEEIEQMTTAEIEAELRAVMEQERLRREQEELARAEAERAAEEARIMEEKARETERLIDELEKERQERLAAKKK